jgi:hypothetical protein
MQWPVNPVYFFADAPDAIIAIDSAASHAV